MATQADPGNPTNYDSKPLSAYFYRLTKPGVLGSLYLIRPLLQAVIVMLAFPDISVFRSGFCTRYDA